MMTERVIGLDISFYQRWKHSKRPIDFEQMKANGAEFVIIKASQGLDIIDREFENSWKGAREAGLLRGAYHFLDYRFQMAQQMELFAELFVNDPPELPLALDLEKRKKWGPLPPRSQLIGWLMSGFQIIRQYNYKPMLYTNVSTIRHNLSPVPDWLLGEHLWLAQYLRQPPFYLPGTRNHNPVTKQPSYQPWDRWAFWQFDDKGDGRAYGVESRGVDLNYFNGSLDDLRKYANQSKPDEPTPAPPPTLELSNQEKLDRLWTLHPSIHEKQA